MKIYHLKTCDTCRKALKTLEGQGVERVEIREDGVPEAVLARWLEMLGPDVLVNKRSTTWRTLSESERAAAPLALLLQHPTLLKRPVIETGNEVLVGWSAQTRETLGL